MFHPVSQSVNEAFVKEWKCIYYILRYFFVTPTYSCLKLTYNITTFSVTLNHSITSIYCVYNIWIFTHTYTYIHIIYICVCVYIYTYIYIYIYIYLYLHNTTKQFSNKRNNFNLYSKLLDDPIATLHVTVYMAEDHGGNNNKYCFYISPLNCFSVSVSLSLSIYLKLLPLWKLLESLSVTANLHLLQNLYGRLVFLF